jgi:long-chain acyl-CoA synthetase
MSTETASAASAVDARAHDRTIARLWRDGVAKRHGFPAYLVEGPEGWSEVSWEEAARRVDDLANGFLALGLRRGDVVAIVGRTCLEWALADYALGSIGAIGAPIYPNSSARDCAYIVEHSESVAVLVEDEEQREKIESARAELLRVRHVLTFTELAEVEAQGREHAREHPHALAEATAAIDENDVFTYIYTSGTTGPPKGCMIRHRNYYDMASCVDSLPEFVVEGDVMLLYLPLAHNFGRLMHLMGPHIGFTLALLPDPLRVGEALPPVRPTVLPSVPRVYEKVYTAVRTQFDAATGVKRKLIDFALRTGAAASPYKQRGEALPRGLAVRHALADRLVYSKVKQKLGGRLRIGISGGAPLAQEIGEFFHALDITILEGYGLTECTTASNVNRPGQIRFGTVGPALPNVEIRIADDGEILLNSPTIFAGYLKDPEGTSAVLREDGWLRTGDVGDLDDDGFLRITDRKKDIIVTAGGKNVAPQNLENALKSATVVSQALVIGDRRPYLTALITIDEAATAGRGPEELEVEVGRIVDDVNRDLSRFEQIKRFAVLPRDFSMDAGEMTPTLKLKRKVVCERYADEIEQLYA